MRFPLLPQLLQCMLMGRLADIDRSTPNNWLDDHFWIKAAYHSWRVPLVVNSNWWLLMKDDEGIPAEVRKGKQKDGAFLLSFPFLSALLQG